ncbi:pyridoxamine 5'-phosphate oxidase-like protein [Mycolicibacterium canariasense]|uniref:Pyridoxamine 5'-phosphate oxidase-like protein n=1 Tax=Mycolicibacterium canariasense TaxID=228230 RepID=A0A100WGN5_MYCCR|nr:pyridoxamine 5'-phosphate oxidase family protein [Mycolicibacterium canariasense]MCV7211717.1 pyridoxamine 5'-phosphate oxidase family protein [Mycolicibacterium canariasense]ORV08250.1 pyridoxamine 5-phosphate oxidase [Mycolicibacterium canariasense]GAS98242.1 pyridoxamine 5'-phosphate oxidase-like protein [Mycolicibacterium canariasense]
MSKHYPAIAFTDDVQHAQSEHGSDTFYRRKAVAGSASAGPDPLTDDEQVFLRERDGFYLATVSQTGWPYVQFRGGPPGFVHTLDEHTIAWADFRGNLQYISTGNLSGDDRVAIIAMDYARRTRLKIFGRARIVSAEADAELAHSLADPAYEAVVERSVVVSVDAFDWNCPQHITPRFSVAELEPGLSRLQGRIETLEAENAELRHRLTGAS